MLSRRPIQRDPGQIAGTAMAAWCLMLGAIASAAEAFSEEDAVFFETRVRPLLVERCYECHGEGEDVEGELRLTSRASALHGGATGPAVVPRDATASLLVKAISYADALQMPPDGKLSDAEIAVLTKWVARGAPWPESGEVKSSPPGDNHVVDSDGGFTITAEQRAFWAFQPISKTEPPAVQNEAWPRAPIDRFISARLEAAALAPSAPADRCVLLRRATFDLIGLPPTPEEVEAFVHDESPDAFAKVIDRLLALPQYGERWSRHWLDLVRYTDSFDSRIADGANPMDCTAAWRYRDWVVDAFNADMPYDQFVMNQIAGDLLPAKDGEKNVPGIIATGVLAIGNWGGGDADKEKLLTDIADDQIDLVGRAFLGLTLACARCHDHKFDPISTQDYYALAGIFMSTHILENPGPKTNGPPMLRVPIESQQDKEHPPAYAHACQEGGCPDSPQQGFHDVQVHIRGRYDRLGPVVPRRFPEVLAGSDQPRITEGSGRLQLAQWLTRPDNPLTARVIVNRIWQHHFGEGLVRTPSNFGKLGEPPTHPDLLNWLAAEFIRSGWSIKAMHRQLMLSAAYQQSSVPSTAALEHDADNRLLSRMNRRRLDAEQLRDSMLAVTGELNATRGGMAVREIDSPRRTLYLMTIRSDRGGFRDLFDGADATAIVDKRNVSTVAPQALFMMNHQFVQARAARLAEETVHDEEILPVRIHNLYRRLFARPASDAEQELAQSLLANWQAAAPENENAAAEMAAWRQYCLVLLCSNEFAFVD